MTDPLSVLFHPRAFWEKKISGVARYVCELTQELLHQGVSVHIPIRDTPTEYLLNASYFSEMAASTPTPSPLLKAICQIGCKYEKQGRFRRLIRRHEGIKALQQGGYDLIHPTHNNSLEILKYRGKTPLVVTVHDMTHELLPQSFHPKDPSAYRKKIMVDAADRVIAISQQTKDDLVRICGTNPNKIDVIHHGNSLILPEGYKNHQLNTPEEYLLFVGQRFGYKNFTRFLRVFAQLKETQRDLHLICAGGGAFTTEENILMRQLGISDVVTQNWVTDEELAILYNRAKAFIYPSEYEGFGLPILEAFACEAPVLCSRASCFPEVAGDAALYFDPCSDESMLHSLNLVCNDEAIRQNLIHKGIERVSLFSWNKCATKTRHCYQKTILST